MPDLPDVRERLAKIDWGEGLNREGIRRQWPDMPAALTDVLPPDYDFRGPGEVMAYLGRVRADIPNLEIGTAGEPRLWGNSPTLGDVDVVDQSAHGVGSGADSGYTGGGSVQSGEDQQGTTYGDARPDRGDPGLDDQGLGAPH